MSPIIQASVTNAARFAPRVLIVDDEPAILQLISEIVSKNPNRKIFTASDMVSARHLINAEKIDLLVTDVMLPDGDGMSLLPLLREKHPHAGAVVITGNPSVNRAVNALRAGVIDFLPKPFSTEVLAERINHALHQQAIGARNMVRLSRLRGAVKKLNSTRHTISKKVDLLCNDLVGAYGELTRQLDAVRVQENFRKLCDSANDLEQLLCHAMDFILRSAGYCNVAIWLAADDAQFELGAYMKYTIPGEQSLTEAMKMGLLPLINREGNAHLFGPEIRENLTGAEADMLEGQEIIGHNCTYLGEPLATVILFRDEKSPFTEEDEAMIRAISPIFAVALATIVRQSQEHESDEQEETGSLMDESEDAPRSKTDSDWWKRGEPPPF